MTPKQALQFLGENAAKVIPISLLEQFNAACKALNDLVVAAEAPAPSEKQD